MKKSTYFGEEEKKEGRTEKDNAAVLMCCSGSVILLSTTLGPFFITIYAPCNTWFNHNQQWSHMIPLLHPATIL